MISAVSILHHQSATRTSLDHDARPARVLLHVASRTRHLENFSRRVFRIRRRRRRRRRRCVKEQIVTPADLAAATCLEFAVASLGTGLLLITYRRKFQRSGRLAS